MRLFKIHQEFLDKHREELLAAHNRAKEISLSDSSLGRAQETELPAFAGFFMPDTPEKL